ncbi:MFS transporter [Kribbella sp. NBC_00889]|uniref:MFS transporter n=1 Tax=Kribbella sp. NBC_00889 TaxID=2975974 RepID=UPI00386E00F4|nr:MFS transporter [Kribbella sp. NBC_00889]
MAWVVRGEFRKLWIGQLVSASGSAITTVALPLVAVVTLQASALQMGLLSALSIAPHLVFGLPAGVWVDRWPLRRILIVTDLGRALLLGTIPLAAATDSLRIEQLYVVAVLTGVLTLLSDTASLTMLPSLVPREDLMRANSAALLNLNLASTTGPSVAGFLVQLVTAPFAILVDAASYLVAATASYLIREPVRASAAHTRARLTTGLRAIFSDRILTSLTLSATTAALAGAMQGPLVVLYLVRELHWSPGFVGVALTAFGVAAVAGTFVATAWCSRVGIGPAYISGVLLASLSGVALATGVTAMIYAAQALSGLGMSLFGVPQRTLRQSLAPAHLLGQVTATWRTVVIGGQAAGAATSGVLATAIGIRPTLLLATAGMLLGVLIALVSPLRTFRSLPATDPQPRSMAED